MKNIIEYLSIVTLALIMVVSSCILTSAEVDLETETYNDTSIVVIDEDGGRAYELVWRYISRNGHMYKRRWNMTLGCWYDPEWILVY